MRLVIAAAAVAIASAGGGAAGYLLRPAPIEGEEAPSPEPVAVVPEALDAVELQDPFVVPILRGGRVWSHAVLTLGIESGVTPREAILTREPRLRDALNRALWTHGALGGFDGDFTALDSMDRLRERLDAVATSLLEDPTARVLLISMTRQST